MKSISRTVPSSVSNSVSSTMVSPRYRRRVARIGLGRRDQPAAVLLGAEQRSEDRPGVEPGYAQPVDRPVAADQRRRLGVADDRVILDGQSQGDLLGSEPSHRFARWRHVFDPRRTSNPGGTAQCTHRSPPSSRSIDYPPTASLHIAAGIGRRQRWPSAEHIGENRPVGSRARPVAAGSAVREC